MIIRRYLFREVLASTLAVALLLTVILMSGRIIKYFGMAADGRLDVSLLTAVLVYRLPGFLELIVPLGMYIGLLLAFGRLYLDNEMAVLSASGVSRAQIIGHLAWPVLLVMLAVAVTSLYVTPRGNAASERLFAEQAERNTFDLIRPGRFQAVGGRMLYVAALSPDKRELIDVRLFEEQPVADGVPEQVVVQAARGWRERHADTGEPWLVLGEGCRHELRAGQAATRTLCFDEYRMRLPPPADVEPVLRIRSHDTASLRARAADDVEARGEWLWRLSMPALVPVVALLALSLSRVNPRQGRYLKLLPAILLYLSYVVALAAVRKSVERGRLAGVEIWGVHLLYLALALLILNAENLRLAWQRWQARKEAS